MIGGIFYGLGAAVGWGVSDFLAARAVRIFGVTLTIIYLQLVGITSFGVLLWLLGEAPRGSFAVWGVVVAISFINSFGAFFIYRAFRQGIVSIVAPIVSSYGVVTLMLAVLLSGEEPSRIAITGALVTVAGVVLVSAVSRNGGTAGKAAWAGVPSALGAMLSFGIFLWAVDFVVPEVGVFWPVMVGKVTDVLLAIGLLVLRPRPFLRPSRELWWRIVVVSLLNSMGFLAFNMGVTVADAAIVAPLSSLASPITILLAWLFFRERLSRMQWLGVVTVLIGVVLVGL